MQTMYTSQHLCTRQYLTVSDHLGYNCHNLVHVYYKENNHNSITCTFNEIKKNKNLVILCGTMDNKVRSQFSPL